MFLISKSGIPRITSQDDKQGEMATVEQDQCETPTKRWLSLLDDFFFTLAEYITTLEGGIAERDRLLDYFHTKLGSQESENLALRQEIAMNEQSAADFGCLRKTCHLYHVLEVSDSMVVCGWRWCYTCSH